MNTKLIFLQTIYIHLLHIECVCDGVHTRVEHWVFKHHLGYITIRVIIRYLNLEPEKRGMGKCD